MRAFRAFAVVFALWIGGRAIVLVETGGENSVALHKNPSLPFRQIAKLEDSVAPMSVQPMVPSLEFLTQSKLPPRSNSTQPSGTSTRDNPVEEAPAAINQTQIIRHEETPARSMDPGLVAATAAAEPKASLDTDTGSNVHRRMKFSGYVFFRGSSRETGLSGNTLLGGSQRAVFAEGPQIARAKGFVIRPFARLTANGHQGLPQEATFGVGAQKQAGPFVYGASLERRIKTAVGGRNAFAARASLGTYSRIDQTPLAVSGHVQAGIVGMGRRDGFAEGEVILAASEGDSFSRAKPGMGLWAAVQPGAARIDIGPTLDIPIIRSPIPVTLRTSWRFRVGGNAVPGSGPALIVATGF